MRQQAFDIFNEAVKSVQPAVLLPKNIEVDGDTLRLNDLSFSLSSLNAIYIIAAGKASAAMVLEAEKILGEKITAGIAVTKYEHALPLQKIKCIEAGHPVPDHNSVFAGHEIMQLVHAAGKNDLIIALISGGASSLLADHPPGTTLQELQFVFQLLLNSGCDIHEMNTVRKHLSQIKGGQLARAAYPATLVSFIISDVIGDSLNVIASGPTVADPTTFEDACLIIRKYGLWDKIPLTVKDWLQKGLQQIIPDTPKENDPAFKNVHNFLIGTNRVALHAAAAKAKQAGYDFITITDSLHGEAKDKANELLEYIINYKGKKPVCLLMGGETTVTIHGKGKGGRNQEFVLAFLQSLIEKNIPSEKISIMLSAGTDGTDGPTDAAGAFIDSEILQTVNDLSLVPLDYLDNNDAYHFFKQVEGLIITGPTQTNVMDLVIVLLQ